MQTPDALQEWASQLDRRVYALLIGLLIGITAGVVGLALAVVGPIPTLAGLFGLFAGLYLLTNVEAALYGCVAVIVMIPFGTLPFRIGFTPTLIDVALGVFLLVYLLQWMTGRRQNFQWSPVHFFVLLYIAWLILSFVLGLRYAMPTSTDLRQFAGSILSMGLVFVLVDLFRDAKIIRRAVTLLMLFIGAQCIVGGILYFMPDDLSERTLVRLAVIGYPNGGVIRYIEDNPEDNERAIGTWVDPNAYGGFLTASAALVAPQLFAKKPIFRRRWMSWAMLGLVGIMLVLTFSRASLLAFALALAFIGVFKGYRKFLTMLMIGGVLFLILPQTQGLVRRYVEAFTGADVSTQMRLGEYGDALELISRYPITGIGFTGTPDINSYTDVASMYLIMGNQIGLVGVGLFLLAMLMVYVYGYQAWKKMSPSSGLQAIFIGVHAALFAILVNSVADMYFFRTDFQGSITFLWIIVGLALACSKVTLMISESTVDKPIQIT